MKVLTILGWVLHKIFKQIYDKVVVENDEMLKQL